MGGDELKARAQAFWAWLVAGDEPYHQAVAAWYANPDDEALTSPMMSALHTINQALRQVHPVLAINFGPPVGDGRHELVITVEGDREGMVAADAVVGAAPALARWKLIKYKPAIAHGDLAVTYRGVPLNARQVDCVAEEVDGEIVVILLVPGLGESEERDRDLKGAALILLDGLIGEWRGLTKIDSLHCARHDQTFESSVQRRPLVELAARLDELRPDSALAS